MATQETLEGVMDSVPAIEDAATAYVNFRDRRMKLTEKEVAARQVLINAMKAAKVETYRTTDGMSCVLSSTDKVKVKSATDEEAPEE